MDSPGRVPKKDQWDAPQSLDSDKISGKTTTKRNRAQPPEPDIAQIANARLAPFPNFVPPSLALLSAHTPEGDNWIHEIKYDGYRLQAHIDAVGVRLLTRKGLDWTSRFPTIARALEPLRAGSAVLDGELIVEDEKGVSDFSGLQTDLKAKRHERLVFVGFDLLYWNGFSLLGATQLDRKAALHELIKGLPTNFVIRYSEHLDMHSDDLLKVACGMGLEGIVSKRNDAPYTSGRSGHWIKSKCHMRQEFVIVGYVPSTAIQAAIGSLVLAYYEKGVLVHAGRVGTGFSNNQALDFKKNLDSMASLKPAFKTNISAANSRGVKWVEPKLVAEVEYRGWSSDNLLRQASFKGLREDKPAKEVKREEAK